MSQVLNFARDVQGYNTFAAGVSTNKFSATLLAAGNSTITVPSNFTNWVVSFSYTPGADVWVNYNGNAAAPVGNTFAATSSELNPGSRSVLSGTTINCYNNGASSADVGIVLYAIS